MINLKTPCKENPFPFQVYLNFVKNIICLCRMRNNSSDFNHIFSKS